MQIAALNNIISSARIGTTTINRAKEIIEKESSTAFEELSSEKSDKYSVKIGKMARGIFSTLILNEEIKTDELSGFMDGFYCKNIFGLNYPLLKRLGKGEEILMDITDIMKLLLTLIQKGISYAHSGLRTSIVIC